ncbi:protein rep [Pseudonocardia sp. T1-2H]|uniref:protein rep n=1 Tax=Pseudonocardia sp. T1-2H TaxID=3128899 RepID=UPI003101A3E3
MIGLPSRTGRAEGRRPGRGRPKAVEAGSLGNTANSSSHGVRPGIRGDVPVHDQEAARRDRRGDAYRVRRRLWDLSSLARVRACGRVSHSDAGGPGLRITEGPDGRRAAGLSGLQTCGSVWACPVCARKIGARRAEDLRAVVSACAAEGGGGALVTLTMRHHAGLRLADCWDALSYAWGRVTSGRAYSRETTTFGMLGWSRVVEVTHGASGWHVHVHALVLFDSPVSDDLLFELAGAWWDRWEKALARRGLSGLRDSGGLDARQIAMNAESADLVAGYFTKVAYEITGGVIKDGRYGNRSPFAILRDGLATGLADDLELWWEWEEVSRGRRQLTWSKGLREWAGLHVEEKTDEEVAAEDLGSDDLIMLPVRTWEAVRHEVEDLLAAAEIGGLAGAMAWLLSRRLSWLDCRSGPLASAACRALPRTTGQTGGRSV